MGCKPPFPWRQICRPVWVGGLLKLLKPAYDDYFVMVRALASTRNETFRSVERAHMHGSRSVPPHHNQVWRLDLASSHLETMTS